MEGGAPFGTTYIQAEIQDGMGNKKTARYYYVRNSANIILPLSYLPAITRISEVRIRDVFFMFLCDTSQDPKLMNGC